MFWLGLALGLVLGVVGGALYLRLLAIEASLPAPRGSYYDVPPPRPLPSYIGTTPEDAEFAKIVDSEQREYWRKLGLYRVDDLDAEVVRRYNAMKP